MTCRRSYSPRARSWESRNAAAPCGAYRAGGAVSPNGAEGANRLDARGPRELLELRKLSFGIGSLSQHGEDESPLGLCAWRGVGLALRHRRIMPGTSLPQPARIRSAVRPPPAARPQRSATCG